MVVTEPTKRGPGRPRKVIGDDTPRVDALAEMVKAEHAPKADVPPGPLVLEVRLGPPGQGKIIFSQRVYAHTIDQQAHQAVITGALHPTSASSDE